VATTAPNPRPRTPRGQGEQTRERLLTAADDLLRETRETAALTIRGVTKRAGVSPMAFYLHFDDRDALLEAVYERHFRGFLDHMRAALAAAGPQPRARLHAAGLAYLRFGLENPGEYVLIFETAAQLPPGPPASSARDAFAFIVDLVREVRPEEPEPRTVAIEVWSALHGTVLLRRNRPSFDWPALEPTVIDMVDRLVPAS
jgi:AcrR family transcriptional regulator